MRGKLDERVGDGKVMEQGGADGTHAEARSTRRLFRELVTVPPLLR